MRGKLKTFTFTFDTQFHLGKKEEFILVSESEVFCCIFYYLLLAYYFSGLFPRRKSGRKFAETGQKWFMEQFR